MIATTSPVKGDPLSGTPDALERCLATLEDAADAADELGSRPRLCVRPTTTPFDG